MAGVRGTKEQRPPLSLHGGSTRKKRTRYQTSLVDNFHAIQDNLEVSLYGKPLENDIQELDQKFATLIQTELSSLNHHQGTDITGFISKLYDKNYKAPFLNMSATGSIEEIFGAENSDVLGFISDAYHNRKLKQNDIKEITSQLTELQEAISVTRDAIVSSDVVEGEISKTLKFKDSTVGEFEKYESLISTIEKNFKLNYRIKNFVINNTLEQGAYYAYIIPYKKLFADFDARKQKDPKLNRVAYTGESTLFDGLLTESVEVSSPDNKTKKELTGFDMFVNECAELFFTETENRSMNRYQQMERNAQIKDRDQSFREGMEELTKRIVICDDPVPLPFLTWGENALESVKDDNFHHTVFTEKDDELLKFRGKIGLSNPEKVKKDKEKEYKDVSDCYLKFIDAPHMVELKIMDKVLGYYYILEEDIRPVSSVITSSVYYDTFSNVSQKKTLIDKLAERITMQFDKKFLHDNIEFKSLIAEALTFYDLNQKRIKFQFIPAEYICAFKIREDENGNGQSILEPSLFYAKLYLMLLLFNIMSFIMYSNDTKVNYIKQSGIDKNIANKIEEIARKKQDRTLNLMDLFSYTSLVKKLGSGSEMYIPVGRSGERGYETEILQGQQVQMNTELMEFLRKCYILGTGVPDAIINYLNEADFAKSIELANTKFHSRIVDLQLDFNDSLSRLYQMLLVYSGGIEESIAARFRYTLTPPKNSTNNVKSEMMETTTRLMDFLTNAFYSENEIQEKADEVREFKKQIIIDYLPMLDMDKIQEYFDKAAILAKKKSLDPRNNNTEDIDDLGMDGNI